VKATATATEKVMAKEMLDPLVAAFHFERRQKADCGGKPIFPTPSLIT